MIPEGDGPSLNEAGKDIFKATLLDIREVVVDHHTALSQDVRQELADSMTLQLHAHLIQLAFQH